MCISGIGPSSDRVIVRQSIKEDRKCDAQIMSLQVEAKRDGVISPQNDNFSHFQTRQNQGTRGNKGYRGT